MLSVGLGTAERQKRLSVLLLEQGKEVWPVFTGALYQREVKCVDDASLGAAPNRRESLRSLECGRFRARDLIADSACPIGHDDILLD